MCHDSTSRPPAPPQVSEVAEHGPLLLTAADGTTVPAYQAIPEKANGVGIVILPDVRGLHGYYVELAERFAEAGFTVTAIDYFGRTAGPGARDDDFDWQAYISSVKPDEVAVDVAAAVANVRARGAGAVYTVGFCFGGSQSWRLSASDVDLAGVIGFYGRPSLVNDVVARATKPVLMLVAGSDMATPQEEFTQLAGDLEAAGVDVTKQVYEGAPHSFFDRTSAEWFDACDDAWKRILAFTA